MKYVLLAFMILAMLVAIGVIAVVVIDIIREKMGLPPLLSVDPNKKHQDEVATEQPTEETAENAEVDNSEESI